MINYKKCFLILTILLILFECTLSSQQTWTVEQEKIVRKLAQEKLEEVGNQDANKFLTVHVLAHSHDDLGFVKTYDEYFFGFNQKKQFAGVRYILDSVMKELHFDPQKKFTYVEMGFFARWYRNLNILEKQRVKTFIKNGQLEIINGGWVMNDEACAYYEDIIDQMTLGHQFLKNELEVVPDIGWQIDPFGHSQTQAYIFDAMGFNAFFFCRLDFQDHVKRIAEQKMEFIWHSSQNSSIFTDVLFWQYGSPQGGFDFDVASSANFDPICEDKESPLYNIKEKADELYKWFQLVGLFYKGHHVAHTFGGDFQYGAAGITFQNSKLLIDYINSRPGEYGMRMIYSTPGNYIKSLHRQNKTYPKNNYDFFPYRDLLEVSSWWTGFFTSRVALKSMIREYGRYIQIFRNHIILKTLEKQVVNETHFTLINKFEEALGVNQHHDAVTGTSTQKCAFDYYRLLHQGREALNKIVFADLKQDVSDKLKEEIDAFSHCDWNVTAFECQPVYNLIKQKKNVLFSVFNPSLKQIEQKIVKIQVPVEVSKNYSLLDMSKNQVKGEIICANLSDSSDCKLYLKLIKPVQMQYNYFKLVYSSELANSSLLSLVPMQEIVQDQIILKLGDQKNLTVFRNNEKLIYSNNNQQNYFSLSWKYYSANTTGPQPAGAYIFKPDNEHTRDPEVYSNVMKKYYFQGEMVAQTLFSGIEIIANIIMQDDKQHLEMVTMIESIDIRDGKGKDIVMQIDTDLKNNLMMYTDSNGLEMQKRIKNERFTFKIIQHSPVASNYYPVTTAAYIRDITNENMMFVLNDRSQGAGALREGQLEFMIHRRMVADDQKGVGEALNETNLYDDTGLRQVVRHQILFTKDKNEFRKIQYDNDLQPVFFFAESKSQSVQSFDAVKNVGKFRDLFSNWPENVKIYLKYWSDNKFFVLRFHNLNEVDSQIVDLTEFNVVEETTMSGNQNLADWIKNKKQWKEENKTIEETYQNKNDSKSVWTKEDQFITLKPMEIRTFKIQLAPVDSEKQFFNQ